MELDNEAEGLGLIPALPPAKCLILGKSFGP